MIPRLIDCIGVKGNFNSYGHITVVGDTYVFSGFFTPVLTQLSLQSHGLLFSHASAEMRGKNTPERKLASTVYRTRNHQVTSPTLSYPDNEILGVTKLKTFSDNKSNV